MTTFLVEQLTAKDREWVQAFVRERWADDIVVGHGTVYHPHALPGFVVRDAGQPVGLITYTFVDDACEIVTIDSLLPGRGIGTVLVEAVLEVARQANCSRLWLITTNDNVEALSFYRGRGFQLVAVHPHAVDLS